MLALAILAAVCLLAAAPAQAHTLSERGAQRVAARYVKRVAGPKVPTSVGKCRSRTRHMVVCVALFGFGDVVCKRSVRVTLAPNSNSARARLVGAPDC